MFRSFRCPDTERLARRKLRQLEIAGNRLEALRGDRSDDH